MKKSGATLSCIIFAAMGLMSFIDSTLYLRALPGTFQPIIGTEFALRSRMPIFAP